MNTGNNLMYLLVSALLGFMAVSGVLGRANLGGLHLDCEPPEEIYDGVETLLTLRLGNRRRYLPSCLLRLELAGHSVLCPLLRRGETVSLPMAVTFSGRGVRRLGAVRVGSAFPINFFIRSTLLPSDRQIVVFPAPVHCRLPAGGRDRPAPGDQADGKGYEGDLTRIGDYRGGEPLKMIHWKLSARHDALKVKELSAAAATPLLIDLEHLPGAGLEERLRCASWLVNSATRAGRPVGLRTAGSQLAPAIGHHHKLALLGALACHGSDPHAA